MNNNHYKCSLLISNTEILIASKEPKAENSEKYMYSLVTTLMDKEILQWDEETDVVYFDYESAWTYGLYMTYVVASGEESWIINEIKDGDKWNGSLISSKPFKPLGSLNQLQPNIQFLKDMAPSMPDLPEISYKDIYINTQDFDTWEKIEVLKKYLYLYDENHAIIFTAGYKHAPTSYPVAIVIDFESKKIVASGLSGGDLILFDESSGWNTDSIINNKLDLNNDTYYFGNFGELTMQYVMYTLITKEGKGQEITKEFIQELVSGILAESFAINGNLIYTK